jgi:hypothetical protein
VTYDVHTFCKLNHVGDFLTGLWSEGGQGLA